MTLVTSGGLLHSSVHTASALLRMFMTNFDITIVIPTAGHAARRASLFQAIESILSQSGVRALPLVVLNGTGYDPEIRELLENRSDIQLVYLAEGSVVRARYEGRDLVRSPYFGCLDDDDYYLPGALAARHAILQSDEACGLVVSNGYYQSSTGQEPYLTDLPGDMDDPGKDLFRQNWLASSGGLFRSSQITLDFFDPDQKYFEWTLTAFRLVQAGIKVRFLDQPHMIINDTEASLSKALSYYEEHPKLWQRIQSENRSSSLRRPIRQKLARSHHELSSKYRKLGQRRKAWAHHLESMGTLYGLRYLPYTRHLFVMRKGGGEV